MPLQITTRDGQVLQHRITLFTARRTPALMAAALLSGCAATHPPDTPAELPMPVAARWHAPLPHGGELAELERWWTRFDDPLLLRLQSAAQQASATLAQAGARIADAQAARVGAGAALRPTADVSLSAARGVPSPGAAASTSASVGVRASWEIDLFGAGRAGASAAQARLQASQAGWHAARVALAAEVASAYVGLRSCEAQQAMVEQDWASRLASWQLSTLAADAGLQAPAAAELAGASAASGQLALLQQRAQCDLGVKTLVALTALDEAELRRELASATAQLPQPQALQVAQVPAAALAQRPDIAAAAWEVIAASADADQTSALRWPRISLSGHIGPALQHSGGLRTDGTVWSLGPVAVTLPLFDAGVRRANHEAAASRHAAARVAYASSLRTAVREVESALVQLQGATARGDAARAAAQGYQRAYLAAELRHRGGLASLLELEDARRSLVAARSELNAQQRDAVLAWVDTYRALGGGWTPSSPTEPMPAH